MTYIPSPLYHQILANIPIPCVDVAIAQGGKILLVKRNDPPAKGQWWLPGGRVYHGEMMRDAAQRKAWEEVGIRCHVGPLIHTAETIFEDGPGGIAVHSINSVFYLYPIGVLRETLIFKHGSIIGYRWVGSIPDDLHPYVVDCLRAAGLE